MAKDGHRKSRSSVQDQLILQDFKRRTKKPTKRILEDMILRVDDHIDPNGAASCYRFGQWLVNMCCLIPLHLAVAKDKRFIPVSYSSGTFCARADPSAQSRQGRYPMGAKSCRRGRQQGRQVHLARLVRSYLGAVLSRQSKTF